MTLRQFVTARLNICAGTLGTHTQGRQQHGRTNPGMFPRREYRLLCIEIVFSQGKPYRAGATKAQEHFCAVGTLMFRFRADVNSKRVFLLGPSHHHYLTKAALSRCTHYATPIGDLKVDRATTSELYKTGVFEWMSQRVDEEEHSLEMHLPYIYKMLSR